MVRMRTKRMVISGIYTVGQRFTNICIMGETNHKMAIERDIHGGVPKSWGYPQGSSILPRKMRWKLHLFSLLVWPDPLRTFQVLVCFSGLCMVFVSLWLCIVVWLSNPKSSVLIFFRLIEFILDSEALSLIRKHLTFTKQPFCLVNDFFNHWGWNPFSPGELDFWLPSTVPPTVRLQFYSPNLFQQRPGSL